MSGGVTATVIPALEPALTTADAAWLSPVSVVLTVQPVGPAPVAEYVWSSVVSFTTVRLKLNDCVLGPRSEGMSFLMVIAPEAF